MTSPVLTFFNNKGGVGKTSLVYHLAWTFASLEKCVVIVDLDPQANLTAAFFDEDKIEKIWNAFTGVATAFGATVFDCVKPLASTSDLIEPKLETIETNLYFLPGDVRLSRFEDTLSNQWPNSMGENNLYRPMRILSSFWEIMQRASKKVKSDIILVDIGPNLGAINRSVLIATDYVMIPLGADLFSLQGLKNLGPTLRNWQKSWKKRLDNWNSSDEVKDNPNFLLPQGQMRSIGYLCQQHSVRLDRPVKAYERWANRIPRVYRESILGKKTNTTIKQLEDPYCLATIKHYRSLIPMAQEHRKPIFNLTSADGAIGAHYNAVQDAKKDFRQLAEIIAAQIGMKL